MTVKPYPVVWYLFRCVSCGWTTPGTYNPNNDPTLKGTVPDTDCPKCGSHDSVCEAARYRHQPTLRPLWPISTPAPTATRAAPPRVKNEAHTRQRPGREARHRPKRS
jgi:hypothetical protein